jgi:GntR family transcriptional regulator
LTEWRDDQPIYRQLYERMLALILAGTYAEGSALPSVRQVSSDLRINHLTVAKAYQELVDKDLVEMRRGMGMFVLPGAQKKIHALEKQKFLQQELPALVLRARQLGFDNSQLVELINSLHKES